MLKTLENNIESEVREWQTKVQEREDETRQVVTTQYAFRVFPLCFLKFVYNCFNYFTVSVI